MVINSIADLRALARARVPRAIFEYADRGSYDELTIARNRSDLQAIEFRQRVMRDLSKLSVASTMAGQAVTMPLAIAPTGLTGLFYGDGEIHGARAAQAFGIPFCLSTMSICSIEDVHQAVPQPFWFQVYLMRDRGFNQELIARARAAQCSALMLTVDLQVQGLRRRDPKNGLSIPPRLTLANAIDIATKPAWALRVLLGKRRTFGNLAGAHARRRQPRHAVGMDRLTIRSGGHLARTGLDQEPVARQTDHQGHPGGRRCAYRGSDGCRRNGGIEPWGPPARWRSVHHFGATRNRRMRSPAAARSGSTAACNRARTCCARWPSEPGAA